MPSSVPSVSLQTLILVMFVSIFGCSGKESKQVQPESSSDVVIRSKSSFNPKQFSVNTALIDGIFLHFDDEKKCLVEVTSLHGSGAGTPVIAVGDTLQVQFDRKIEIADARMNDLMSQKEMVRMTLQHIKPGGVGADSWVLIDMPGE